MDTCETGWKIMTPTSVILDASGISHRRAELVRSAGMGLERLRERDAHFDLDLREQAVLRRLEELEFLEGR